MYGKTQESLQSELQAIKDAGLFKKELYLHKVLLSEPPKLLKF
jgi:hypothetical protein